MKPNYVHYEESADMKKHRLRTSANFKSGPICGNARHYCRQSPRPSQVTCPECITMIADNPNYYSNNRI